MIRTLLQALYTKSYSINNKNISKAIQLTIRTISNIIIPLWYFITPKQKIAQCNNKNHPLIIVSITSFPKRISKVWIVIESLMRQNLKPNKIILYLSKEQFYDISSVPNSLLKMHKRGLEIKIKEGDLKSHKKYYYAFIEYPEDIVITVDDDIIYPQNTIKELVTAHKLYPDCIIARYAHFLGIENNTISPYVTWKKEKLSPNPCFSLFFGSGGGTLFPVSKIDKDICNKDVFMSICKLADDIWLNSYTRHSRLKTYLINNKSCSILNLQIMNDERLSKQNIEGSMNDLQIKNIQEYFQKKYNYSPFLLE